MPTAPRNPPHRKGHSMETQPLIYMNQLHRSQAYRMPESHAHQAYELYYLLSGSQKFFIHHTVYSMQPGDLALISPGVLHRTNFSGSAAHERIVVIFQPDAIRRLTDAYPDVLQFFLHSPVMSIPPKFQAEAKDLFLKLFREYEAKDAYSPFLLHGFLNELLLFLARRHADKAPAVDSGGFRDSAVGSAAYYISQHYSQPITLEDAARIANLSPTYFSRKFKQITGFGFKEYLNSIRIQKASLELLHTRDSITDIALRCGFGNSNYFGDIFFRETGMSPRTFRTQHREA